MKSSSYNTTVTTEPNHPSHQHLSWSSRPFPSSRSFLTAASTHARGDPAGLLVFPKLPHNMISVRSAANLDKNTTSSSYEAEVSTHKRSAEGHIYASSLSSDLDFEFDSCCLSDVNHDGLPVSPKLICPSTAYNFSGGLHNKERSEVIMQQINPLPSPPPYTPVINARKQPSAPPSRSTGQLMAEELSGDHKGYDLDYYSPSPAPRTPNLQKKQEGQLFKQRPSQDNSSSRGTNVNEYQTRSKSAIWDRRAFIMELPPVKMQKQVDLTGGLEHNSHLQSSSSSSSSNGSSDAAHAMGINELFDQQKNTRMKSIQKHRSSNSTSNKKCTFQDLLGWTGALDPPANPNFESRRQSTSSSISSPKPYSLLSGLSKSTHIRSSASPPSAVKHAPPTQLAAGHPSPTSRSSPRSAYALLYKQKKAQSDEHRKKTFLPYRQSLLGC